MKTKFIANTPNARILRNKLDRGEGIEKNCFIERCVLLKHHNFIYFREHLTVESDLIKLHRDDMFIDENCVWHVIMVCSVRSDIMLLIYSDETNYPKYVSIKTNGGEQIEPKFTTSKRYSV